ncbi:hypothetical protein M9H77_12262 [Catharanthus roseus]|uniref:Uncharacterized protein n=1 Tax=Catharanthus roseus TaxID=4058 RepID=A0ACC0BH14_CATRO|nr:hypothetical protein M9H77_12262 [Catharanthus roseus]
MHSFHHGGGNGFNAYGGNNHGNGDFTSRRHVGVEFPKANKLSQAQDVIDRKVIHYEKKNTCIFVKEEKSREEKVKSVVSTKESEGNRKGSECLIKNHEILKEEQVEEKQDEIEKSEETKEEMSLMIFERDEREEMRESSCDISSSSNSLSSKEVNLFTNSNNHFLTCFSLSVQKFEAQDMENEGSLSYRLYKTIIFLPSTSFLSFDFIINDIIVVLFLSFVIEFNLNS